MGSINWKTGLYLVWREVLLVEETYSEMGKILRAIKVTMRLRSLGILESFILPVDKI